jgi:hypothetical protein
MHKQRFLRASLVAVLGVLAALAVPAAAQAHHVNAADSSVTCFELRAVFEGFEPHDGDVSYTIDVGSDGSVEHAANLGPLDTDADSHAGDKFTLVVALAVPAGVHSVTFVATWPNQGDNNGSFTKTVGPCDGPPPPPPPVYDCQGNVLPPGTTPPTCPPPPPAVPSTPTTPGAGVLPETVASGLARLRGPSGCVKRTFPVRVSGRSIASVSFRLDGKLIKRFTSTRSTYTIKVNPRKYGFGRHRIIARVTFLTASGTKSRRLPLTFRRCARGTIAPRFTG